MWLVFAGLLVARALGIISVYFFEEDEVSLAVGAAALVADTPGFLYRYSVQVGYYRLIEAADLILGARIDLIPWIMKLLSAVAGAVIPIAGFQAFKLELTTRQRWLVLLLLAVNPIVWRSSQYGNSALIATALASVGLAMLSNRPRGPRRIVALVMLAFGVLVRADTVLLTPITFWLLRSADGRAKAIRTTAAFVLALAGVYATLSIFDPRMDSAAQSVSRHMLATPNPTMFWEFLLWAMSPFACIFAIWGFRALFDSQGRLAVHLLLWCVPTLLFYFQATTTCRYFLNAAVPLSIAAAVGLDEIAERARRRIRAPLAWAMVLGVAVAHLFIALGRISPTQPAEIFYGGMFATHDGPMPTGAFLARTYLTPGSLLRGLPRPRFGAQDYPFWQGVAFNKAVHILADPAMPSRNVVILQSGGFGHALHFHAHAAGARYLAGPTDSLALWGGAIRFRLANSEVTTIGSDRLADPSLKQLDLKADDLLWICCQGQMPDADTLSKLPPGLTLRPTPTFDQHFRTFLVTSMDSTGR